MWRFAIQNLVSRPLRSLLALAGLSVAIAGMVGLFSVAEGIDRMVTDTFSRIPGLAMMQAEELAVDRRKSYCNLFDHQLAVYRRCDQSFVCVSEYSMC